MKAHIDTVEKTIKIDDNIVMGDLELELDKLFPTGEWRFYTLIITLVPPPAYNNAWINSIPITNPMVPSQGTGGPLGPPSWTVTQSSDYNTDGFSDSGILHVINPKEKDGVFR